jgi:hypothetical protein
MPQQDSGPRGVVGSQGAAAQAAALPPAVCAAQSSDGSFPGLVLTRDGPTPQGRIGVIFPSFPVHRGADRSRHARGCGFREQCLEEDGYPDDNGSFLTSNVRSLRFDRGMASRGIGLQETG